MFRSHYYNTLIILLFFIILSCNQQSDNAISKPMLLTTETVIPGKYGDHDTLDYQLTIFEDSIYSLSYKKHIQDPENIYGGEIYTDYKKGKAKIKKDSIFLTNDTLLLTNGYVEFIKNGKIDFVRRIDSTTLKIKSTYTTQRFPKYHIIQYETWTTVHLKGKKEFTEIFKIDDEALFEIERLIKDTVDNIMPKTKVIENNEHVPYLTPKPKTKLLTTPKGEPCCYYESYYKKMLPYIDQNGHKIIKLFLSLEAINILEADFPTLSDGGYYFLDIHLNLTEKKITWIGHYGYA